MARHRHRRMLLDLTPMMDIISLLLFGVMISSVVKAEKERNEARSDATVAEVTSLREKTSMLQAERQELNQQLAVTRKQAARALAVIERLATDDSNSEVPAEHLEAIERALEQGIVPPQLARLRFKVGELSEASTTVELHLLRGDMLMIVVDGRSLPSRSLVNMTDREIEEAVSEYIANAASKPLILVLFTYEGAARDLMVERIDRAVRQLVEQRAKTDRSVRYGRVGLIDTPPLTREN